MVKHYHSVLLAFLLIVIVVFDYVLLFGGLAVGLGCLGDLAPRHFHVKGCITTLFNVEELIELLPVVNLACHAVLLNTLFGK